MPTRTSVGQAPVQQPDLSVVRRDHHDVAGRERARRARPGRSSAYPRARPQGTRSCPPPPGSVSRCQLCSTGRYRIPVPAPVVWRAHVAWLDEPALVHLVGDEPAHVRMHPPRLGEEDAAVLRHRRVDSEQMLEHARVRPRRMRRLRHLRQLQRVAEQDQVARSRPGGDGVGERELASLVDDEVVELVIEALGSEEPRRAGDESVRRIQAVRVLADILDLAAVRDATRGVRGGLARAAESDAALVGGPFDLLDAAC